MRTVVPNTEQLGERSSAALFVAAVSPTVLSLLLGATGGLALVLTVAGVGGSLVASRSASDTGPTPPALWCSVAVLTVVALIRAPIWSHDLWSYGFYGRIWSHYGANPYRVTPAHFPHDNLLPLVGWTQTPSVYGPLFTGFSGAVTRISGNSLLATRLFFQGAAAASVLGCLGLLKRAGQNRTLVLVASTPFVWISVVNGGHNDALVAVAALAAVVAFNKDQWTLAGVLVAAAAMVKFPGFFVMAPFLAILATRHQWTNAARLCIGPTAALLGSFILVPRSLENASAATGARISRASIWRPLQILTGAQAKPLASAAIVLGSALIVLVAIKCRSDRDGAFAAGASLASFGFGATYTLPWYQFWGLPAIALSGDVAMTTVVALRGSLMLASYQVGGSSALPAIAGFLITTVSPVALFGIFLHRISTRSPSSRVTLNTTEVTQSRK